MKTIHFTDIEITSSRISFSVTESIYGQEKNQDFYYSFDEIETPSAQTVAAVLCSLTGTVYDHVLIDMAIDSESAQIIRKFTKADVDFANESLIHKEQEYIDNNTILLNFSGGFDSLALHYLLPQEITKLVSINFGGWFQREADFFKCFPTHVVETNIRRNSMKHEISLADNDWRFMGAAALIYADSLNAGFNSFGSVMDSSAGYIRDRNIVKSPDIVFEKLGGLKDLAPSKGITQVGSIMIVGLNSPGFVIPSLDSLANKGSDKRRMKELFIKAVSDKFELDMPRFEETVCTKRGKFGEHYDYDIMALYILKRFGREVASEIIDDIPDEAMALCEDLKLDFYERLNMNYINELPDWYISDYLYRLAKCHVLPYEQDDYDELQKVYDFLVKYEEKIKHENL